MIPSFYKSGNGDFTIIEGDCVETLSKFRFQFDMIFADPPYFLSSGGLSCHAGKAVCVDKGEWDKQKSVAEMDDYNYRWLESCRSHLKDDGTIWVCGTYHNIFSIGCQMARLGFKILNVITWAKRNPPPNLSCRYFTHSAEFVIWARKSVNVPHYFNYELMKVLNDNVQMKDVWHLPSIAAWEKDCGKHPTQKPLCLLVRAILASTKENSWILDPCSGSGTTGIAANLLNRRYLGLEICREYLDMSKNRRQSLDIPEIRSKHIEKLIAAKAAPAHVFGDVVGESEPSYGVPWL